MRDFPSDNTAAVDTVDGLFVPANERELRRVQRRSEELDKQVRSWAESIIRILPRGLPINSHEVYVLSLFLAQQRRLNVQMDGREPDETFGGWVMNTLAFLAPRNDPGIEFTVHRVIAARLDSEIDRAVNYYCREHGVSPEVEESLDWRVAIRFMAQSIFSRVADAEPKKMAQSPRRFELALVARDLAATVQTKRMAMSSVAPTPVA
ncbi:MAG TPA: hypothetical protein VMR52_07020 [Dehalococcoidia bacterium]|nr:hypothetical protein [Dehalococcoidia bacterium]